MLMNANSAALSPCCASSSSAMALISLLGMRNGKIHRWNS
jgi:hypothetical protein